MENVDLHCHSRASDGLLSPGEVVQRAHARGVTMLSLTDHDGTNGLDEAAAVARELGIAFVPGVEVSVTWNDTTVHVVGLGVDAANESLEQGLARLRGSRRQRAEKIATGLASSGISGSLDGAMSHADNAELISRTHFARYLVEKGYARDLKAVFRSYLVPGRPGYVPHTWAVLGDAIGWIRAAGGVAVVAHPGRYKFAGDAMRRFLAEFADCGGRGLELVTAGHTRGQIRAYSALARRFGMLGSLGSDFHAPGESRFDFASLPALPHGVRPVWQVL